MISGVENDAGYPGGVGGPGAGRRGHEPAAHAAGVSGLSGPYHATHQAVHQGTALIIINVILKVQTKI